MEEYKVRSYQKEDYKQVLDIVNQLFFPIFSPFVNIPYERGPQFMMDFNMIDEETNHGLYVVEVAGAVAGVMKLNAKEINNEGMSISLSKIFKHYGIFKVIKAILLFRALNTKIAPDEVYVDYLVVNKDFRSLGIGTTLLKYGVKIAKDMNKQKLTLNVLDNNPRGRQLYERFGFQFIKETRYPRFVRKRLGASADNRMEMLV